MSRFGEKRTDLTLGRQTLEEHDLIGINVAVIGGTNGIGRAIAQECIAKGAEVIVVGRTFRDQGIPRLTFIQADLSVMKNALKIAKELPAETLDLLILTQGIFAGKQRITSKDNIELDLAISYLSRFVIVREMASRLGKNRDSDKPRPRVFVWGFPGSDKKVTLDDFNSEINYNWMTAHTNGLVGNEALVLDSAECYPTVNFYGMNPGIISSNIMAGVLGEGSFLLKVQQTIMGWLFQSAEQYARRIVPLLVSKDIENHSGTMFGRYGDPIHSNPSLLDKSYSKQIIEETEKLITKTLS